MDMPIVHKALSDWASEKPLVGRVFIFGSRVRGDHGPGSDLDIAVEIDLSAARGMDESGGLATWMSETKGWKMELEAILPFEVDLEQYRGEGTPTIHQALARSSHLVYAKYDFRSENRN